MIFASVILLVLVSKSATAFVFPLSLPTSKLSSMATTTVPASSSSSSSSSSIITTTSITTALGSSRSDDELSFFDKLFQEENEKLFTKFDVDSSGTIDKKEFESIVREMNSESRRRYIISVASAVVGGFGVSSASQTFQFGQKTLRQNYLEPSAEKAMYDNFPTAILSGDCEQAIYQTLKGRGFTSSNTLLGHSVCSDEVNTRGEQLIPLLIDRWNKKGFALGGLAGLPFAGKSGFGAYLHHVPDDGKLLVVFAPHVGVDAEGKIGGLQRDGQVKVSNACGAAIGAYKALQSKKATPTDPLLVMDTLQKENIDTKFDPQLEQIVQKLAPRLKGIDESKDSISFVTYQMYGIIRELITSIITQTDDVFDYATEVAVVGGIIINRRKGGDFFQPLSFETYVDGSKNGYGKKVTDTPVIDLFEETFGDRPNLQTILGSQQAIDCASIISS